MKKTLLALSAIVMASAFNTMQFVSTPQARVILKEKTKFYTVTGNTGAELYKSMLKNGPDHGGKRRDVLASTSFEFNFANDQFTIKRNRCVLTNLDIIVSVTYTYPKWKGSRKASAETRKAWKEFERIAVLHEKEHVKITRKFANDYEKALKRSRRKASSACAQETVTERFRTNREIRRHERLHRNFDRRDLKRGGRGYKALLSLVKAK
jgi:predicted secreted Zn-dependent protease